MNGFRMHYQLFGSEGQPLLWLSGWTGTGADWKFAFQGAAVTALSSVRMRLSSKKRSPPFCMERESSAPRHCPNQ